MAQHFMNVAARLPDKSEKFSLLPPSSLYLLAAPSTPDQAIVEIEQKLDAGERLQTARVAQIIGLAREQAQRTAPAARPALNDAERQRVRRLAQRLADVARRLEGRPAKDWAVLFGDRRLARVRGSLVELLQEVQELLGEPPYVAPSPDFGDRDSDSAAEILPTDPA
jgi:hypothetical protein